MKKIRRSDPRNGEEMTHDTRQFNANNAVGKKKEKIVVEVVAVSSVACFF